MEEGKDEPSPSGSILDLDLDCLHQVPPAFFLSFIFFIVKKLFFFQYFIFSCFGVCLTLFMA